MRTLEIGKNQAGQRLDKYLKKYFREAPDSFLYRMLRKKNILLNEKKASGGEKLKEGDTVRLYLAEETIEKFRGNPSMSAPRPERKRVSLDVIYQDEDVIFINKPAGMLSQKAGDKDISLVEYLIGYLLDTGALTREELDTFRPSVCNRLDRNTSGLVLAGKSLKGLQELSLALKERTLKKYYICLVKGVLEEPGHCRGYLTREKTFSQVRIQKDAPEGASPVETAFVPLWNDGKNTLLKVELITGKTHQIRSHMASLGYPLAGDPKYGDAGWNRELAKRYGLKRQFLHAYELDFSGLDGCLPNLEKSRFTAPLPKDLTRVLKNMQCPLKR